MSAARDLMDTGTPGPWWEGGSWWIDDRAHPLVGHGNVGSDLIAYTIDQSRADARKIVLSVNALPLVDALLDLLAGHRSRHCEKCAPTEYCLVCRMTWPCATSTARDALEAALRGEG